MIVLAEEAAPSWVPVVAFAVPAVIVLLVLIPALRLRGRAGRARRAQARQVFIRMGPDEKLEGGTTMLSNRHVRSITVLRVDAPEFDVESENGVLRASGDSPPDIQGLVGRLGPDEVTWSDAVRAREVAEAGPRVPLSGVSAASSPPARGRPSPPACRSPSRTR